MIELPPLPRIQVPFIEGATLSDIRVLARWCERIATDYARAAVLADRARRELRRGVSVRRTADSGSVPSEVNE